MSSGVGLILGILIGLAGAIGLWWLFVPPRDK